MIAAQLNRIKGFLQLKIPVNYLYFGSVFLFIYFLHSYHVLLIELDKNHLEKVFLFHSFIQSFLEVSGLILFYSLIHRLTRFARIVFILMITVLLLIHGIDFFLVRIMGLSFWNGIGLILNESWANFIELLYASHVTLFSWIVGGISLIGLTLIGYLYYECTERICVRKQLLLPIKYFLLIFCFLPVLAVSVEELIRGKKTSFQIYREYQQALPWKNTFCSQKTDGVRLKSPIREDKDENYFQKQLQAISPIKNKPDLFFFVIESLRSDFINQQVTPYFYELKQSGISTKTTLSSANGTALSWFSLFYSKFPYYFSNMKPSSWKMGSPPLQILKKLGYDIHVFSSVRLAFYQMDQRIFGVNNYLGNSFHLYPHDDVTPAHECDQKTMQKLMDVIQSDPKCGGRCFIIFLESTHFDYSWPLESDSHFHPFAKNVNYMKVAFTKKGLEKIINRYRNAVHYLDRLFGQFVDVLKKTNNWASSMLVITGDHGEEFYERGHLFHASSLSAQQTEVPIIFKFPSSFTNDTKISALSSHIDIFPTFLDYLMEKNNMCTTFLDGESILQEKKWPYALIARYNASRSPYEFMIHDGKHKVLIQFNNKKEIFLSNAFFLLDVQTAEDQPLNGSISDFHENFVSVLEKFSLDSSSFSSTALAP